eukprot:scaffold1621_cov301-Alexandrium_tamarense.AAC.1
MVGISAYLLEYDGDAWGVGIGVGGVQFGRWEDSDRVGGLTRKPPAVWWFLVYIAGYQNSFFAVYEAAVTNITVGRVATAREPLYRALAKLAPTLCTSCECGVPSTTATLRLRRAIFL